MVKYNTHHCRRNEMKGFHNASIKAFFGSCRSNKKVKSRSIDKLHVLHDIINLKSTF